MSVKIFSARSVEASRERAAQSGARISPKIQGLMSRFQEEAPALSPPPSLVRRSAILPAEPASPSVVAEPAEACPPSSPPLSPRQEGTGSPYLERLNQAIAASPISPRSSRRGTLRGFAVVKKEFCQVQPKDTFLVEVSKKIQEKDPTGTTQCKRTGNFCLIIGKEGRLEWVDAAKASSKDVEKAIALVLRELETCLRGKLLTIEEEGERVPCPQVMSRLLLNPKVQEVLSDPKNGELRQRVISYFQAAMTDEPRADVLTLQQFFHGTQETLENLSTFLSRAQEAAVVHSKPALEALLTKEVYSSSEAAPILAKLGVGSMLGGPISDEDCVSYLKNILAEPTVISISNGRSLCSEKDYFAQVREGLHEYTETLRVMDRGLDQFLELEAGRRVNEARRLDEEEAGKAQRALTRMAAAENHNRETQRCYDSHDYGRCLAYALKRANRAVDIVRDTLPTALKSFGLLAIHHLFAQEKITGSQAAELSRHFGARTKEPIVWNSVAPLLHTLSVLSECEIKS